MFDMRQRKSQQFTGSQLISTSVSLSLLFFALSSSAAVDDTHLILERAKVKLASKKNQAHVTLKIIEAGGEIKSREMNLETLETENGFKALVRMTAPVDYKGTALLAVIENGEQRQWIYLPSSKQVRRIASVNKGSGLLGSELNPEDLNPDALKDAAVKLISKDKTSAVIELTPKAGMSEYSSARTTFSLSDDLPQKTEYFKAGVLQKTVEFLDYKSFEGGTFRAQKVHIQNVIKNRGTDLELAQIKVNPDISAKDFTPEALKADW
jgi:outer membrane lipoprotein-sorting protein